MKIAIITTYLPSKCGIATYTHDLRKSLLHNPLLSVDIIAIRDEDYIIYPDEVRLVINKHSLSSYEEASNFINSAYDYCIIQHEYGIFGGSSGEYIINLVEKLQIPILTIFHTILRQPSSEQKLIIQQLSTKSKHVVVMTAFAVDLLENKYDIIIDKISHIPHGVPVFDFNHRQAKNDIGITDKIILLSFGFLGRGKGFETAIKAIANLKNEDLVYIILGTTHPNVLKYEGEQYRESLIQECEELGVANQVQFINKFASEETLAKYLIACDMYVTPYPNEDQISSGTLSFAIGAGAAVISTPYIYAKDILKNNVGLLFDFHDNQGLADILQKLIESPDLLNTYRGNAKSLGLKMQWPEIGKRYLQLLDIATN